MKKFLFMVVLVINTSTISLAFNDVSVEYNDRIMPLVKKGIITGYPDNTFRKDDYITRSAFCKMIAIYINAEDKGNVHYSDVDENHWAYDYISILSNERIIDGINNNLFSPNTYVTYEQAIKMIISSIGYSEQAGILGGYPNGYITIAKELNIFDIGYIKATDYATRGDIVDILLNTHLIQDENMIDDVIIKNYKLSRVITCRNKGNIEGIINSKDIIKCIKWAFLDMDNNLIKIDKYGQINNTKDINLKNYLDKIDFSELGEGKFQFRLFIETQKDIYKIIDSIILVVSNKEEVSSDIAILNMLYFNLSQSIGGEEGHKGTFAIDLVGLNGNVENFYAPFDGTIKKIYSEGNQQNFVWLESENKIKYADGTYDYVTVMTGHDNDISNLYIGKKIKQGEKYYQEGNSGKSTGNHIHLEVGRGKVTEEGWIKNKYDKWQIDNHIRPDKVFYISDDTTIINLMDLTFVYN